MQVERRVPRSPYTNVALARWLRAVARREGFDHVVLADDRGFLVAGSGQGIVNEVLAAVAPLGRNTVKAMPEFHDVDVTISSLRVFGAGLVLCAVGRDVPCGNEDLEQAKEGVVRILAC